MTFKTAETTIDRKALGIIYKNWRQSSFTHENSELLDETSRFLVKLNVQYQSKGDLGHITIPSELKEKTVGNKMYLTLHSNLLKPLIFSVFIGLIAATLFFFLNRNILFAILVPIAISTIYFAYLYSKVRRAAKRFLSALKEHWSNRD